MYRKKTVIMIAMIAAVMLMALGYAAFATRLNINTTGNITSTWNVYFSNITEGVIVGTASNNTPPSVSGTTAYFDMNLRLPGESITYEVTLTNGGTVGAIISDIKAEAEGSSAIMYSISGLKVGDKLAGGASKTITVKTEYADVMDQPSVTSKTLVITIDAVQDVGQTITQNTPSVEQVTQLRSEILKNNEAQSDTGIDIILDDVTGLYYTNTNTEHNQTTYYFRGNVENNYVKFGQIKESYSFTDYNGETHSFSTGDDILWRIVRINEDGSIRLIVGRNVLSSDFNQIVNDDAYLGYMYGEIGSNDFTLSHTNTNDSLIKEAVDDWYNKHLTEYSSYLADAGFCGDRVEIGADGYGDIIFNSNTQRDGYIPTFSCKNARRDLYTLKGSIKGNGALDNPVGLLSASEATYAGQETRQDSYLYQEGQEFWTMTPAGIYDNQAFGQFVSGSISVCPVLGWEKFGVRPVINLKSDIGITGGDGTVNNPYVISLD